MYWESISNLIINEEVDDFLVEKGFYLSNMNSFFYINDGNNKIIKYSGVPCYSFEFWEDLKHIHINVNKYELFVEIYDNSDNSYCDYRSKLIENEELSVEFLGGLIDKFVKELIRVG